MVCLEESKPIMIIPSPSSVNDLGNCMLGQELPGKVSYIFKSIGRKGSYIQMLMVEDNMADPAAAIF